MPFRTLPGVCTLLVALPALSSVAYAQTDTSTPPNTPAPPSTPEGAPTDEPHRLRIQIGPQVGTYLPTSAKTRDRFGDAWLILGIGLGSTSEIHPDHRFLLDLQVLSGTRSGAQATIAPIGLSYAFALGPKGGRNTAFAGISADAVVASLRSDRDNMPTRTRFTGGGSLFIGDRFAERGYVEARYNSLAPVRGFDLSGLNLTLGLRF